MKNVMFWLQLMADLVLIVDALHFFFLVPCCFEVFTCQQQPSWLAEGNTRDSTDDVVMGVHAELLVGSDVEEPAGGVVRPCCKSVPVREELRKGG